MQQQTVDPSVVYEKAAETPFLIDLFNALNDQGVAYCVLGGSGVLPLTLNGGDVDILVSPDSIDRAEEILFETGRAHGGHCISRYEVETKVACFCGTDRGWWGVHVDLFPACAYRALPFMNSSAILRRAVVLRGVRMAASEDAALYRLMKEVIYNGRLKRDYKEKAQLAYVSGRGQIQAHLRKVLGFRLADLWCRALSGETEPLNWHKLSRISRRTLFFRCVCSQGYRIIVAKFRNICRRLKRISNPPGTTIAILGTDGSGKSTVIEAILPILKSALNHEPRYEHMRPNLLPSLARLFRRPIKEGPTTEPHAGKPSGFLASLVRLSYYTVDYVVGYWVKVFPATVKRARVYVFDRYFYDYYVDPRRSRISLPRWIIKVYGLFVPRPDIILCLGAEAARIHERKPELPLEELTRQLKELKTFCDKNKRAVWIDTGCSIEDSVNHALEAITSRMAARYE